MIIVKDGESLMEDCTNKKKNEFSLFNAFNAMTPIPRCPLCGGYILRYRRTIHGEDPIFIYDCIECGHVIAHDFQSARTYVATGIGGDDNIKKIFRRTVDTDEDVKVKKDAHNEYSDIMEANGLKTKDELLEFLANQYRYREEENKDNAKQETATYLMTIDDAENHIKFEACTDTNGKRLLYTVTVSYIPDIYDMTPTTVEFECSSLEELKTLWEDYIEVNDIYPDCITGFDIDLSMKDRNYINRLKESMNKLLREIKTDSCYMPTAEDALNALLSSKLFEDIADSIVFPHTKFAQKGQNPKDTVKIVKRYYSE